MRRALIVFALLGIIISLASSLPYAAEVEKKPVLATINGSSYDSADFFHWWKNIRQENDEFPNRPEDFLNWHLLVQEAQKMELFTLPSFQHKVEVFLKVRALIMLKNEEVDSKITVSDDEIRKVYDSDYVPQRYMVELHFSNREDIKKAHEIYLALKKDKPEYSELHKYAGSGELPLFMVSHPKWYQPLLIPKEVFGEISGLGIGDFSTPFQARNGVSIFQILEIKKADQEDFARRKNDIHEKIRKKKHQLLTDALLTKLKKKYNVRVNEELLGAFDIANPSPEDMDKVLVSSDRSQVDVSYFVAQAKRQASMGPFLSDGPVMQLNFKRRLLNSMISNSLIDWEALDRHYEEKEPLKWVYQFYRQNRLIAELKKRIYEGLETAEDPELQKYYQEHKAEFSEPYMVRLTFIQGGRNEMQSLWADSLMGRDIMKSAHGMDVRIISDQDGLTQNYDALSPIVKEKIALMNIGEVTAPFVFEGKHSIIRLDEKIPLVIRSFEQAKVEVLEKVMKEKRDIAYNKFLGKLKSQSSIELDNEIWSEVVSQQKKENQRQKDSALGIQHEL